MVGIGCAFKRRVIERVNGKTFKGITYKYVKDFGAYCLFEVDNQDEFKALSVVESELCNDYNFKGMFLGFNVIDIQNKIKFN